MRPALTVTIMYTRNYRREELKGWGNYPRAVGNVFRPERTADLLEVMARENGTVLARGGGTAYGDAAINSDGLTIDTRRLNKMLDFDAAHGVLHCESGVPLGDIVRTFLPRGWFLNVTPGSQHSTVGGCVACDAHGKNWKAGSFGAYVQGVRLMLDSGELISCDDTRHSDLFYATMGGMGMTGVILDVRLRLKPVQSSFVDVEAIAVKSLKELFVLQAESVDSHEYLFSWVDSHEDGRNRGRGVLQRANHRTDGNFRFTERRTIPVPMYMPGFVINKWSVEAFNAAYFRRASAKRRRDEVPVPNYFYPLDSVGNWNRVYGKRGFVEYQVAVPTDGAYEVVDDLLRLIARSRLGSTVAAVKPLRQSRGVMSFPIDGYTMAVDFAYSDKLWKLLDELDDIVIQHGGRVYLAKDSRLSAGRFRQMYSGSLEAWQKTRGKYKLEHRFDSSMFQRLGNR